MSLPLPRRIAQAALLLGAAAAPLIGAGAAHAAALPQQGLGGLSNLDTGVQNTSHRATVAAGQNGEQALRTALPAADRVAGTLTPTARSTTGQAADEAGRTLGATAESASGTVPGAETLPTSVLPNTGALPLRGARLLGGLPAAAPLTDTLPLKSLPLV